MALAPFHLPNMGDSVRHHEVRPFHVVLEELRDEAGLSQENLAFEARAYVEDGLTTSTVNKLELGHRHPTIRTMEALAKALGVEPDLFAEYRLALVRRLFDEREIGLDAALAHLAALEAQDVLAQLDREVARQAKAARPSGRAANGRPSRRAGRRRRSA